MTINANIGGEDKKISEALGKMHSLEPLSKEVRNKSLDVLVKKDDVRNEFKKMAVRGPDESPSRVIEQEVVLTKLELAYIPFYDLQVEAKGQRKMIKLNALTREDHVL